MKACSQTVRQRVLVPSCRGSNPFTLISWRAVRVADADCPENNLTEMLLGFKSLALLWKNVGTGIHHGLKIRGPQGIEGSTPSSSILG